MAGESDRGQRLLELLEVLECLDMVLWAWQGLLGRVHLHLEQAMVLIEESKECSELEPEPKPRGPSDSAK